VYNEVIDEAEVSSMGLIFRISRFSEEVSARDDLHNYRQSNNRRD